MRPPLPLLSLALLLIASSPVLAEVLSTRDDIRRQTGTFMDMIANGRVVAAYNSLRPFLGVDAGAYDESAKEAATYFQRVRQQAGEPVGSSHVATEIIASDFTRETWLQKFEAAAIAWRFTYYQPDVSGWKLVGVSYSTELDDLYHSAE